MSASFHLSCVIVLLSLFAGSARLSAQRDNLSPEQLLQIEHENPQWPTIQAHLPDPATASAEKLEMAADVLRARRFFEDALNYYMYAAQRGGKEIPLLNKMGITELEMAHTARARAYFKRVVKLKKKSAEGWNNLGAVEYMDGEDWSAIHDYRRAIKLNKKVATYHLNLGNVYLERKDFDRARKQFGVALKLDPDAFEHSGTTGVTARMLTADDHARFCYEMARIYAESGDVADMLHYLTMSSEGGFDVLEAMRGDGAIARYRKDPRVLLLVRNARALRNSHASVDGGTNGIPPLKPTQQLQRE